MGDGGVVAQRYQLALFGNHQRLELQAWQPDGRTVAVEFPEERHVVPPETEVQICRTAGSGAR
jgi:hypothetical protein